MRTRLLPLALITIVTQSASAQAQTAGFHWSGSIAPGKSIEVRAFSGSVHARPSDDGSVRVEAVRTGSRMDPERVRLEVLEHAGGVTICAIYPPTAAGADAQACRPIPTRSNDARVNLPGRPGEDSGVRVDYVVHVPAGVRFGADLVNGDIAVGELRSDARAETVEGGIVMDATGHSEATTTNGSIRARLGPESMIADARFSTVNGGITLEIAEGVDADVRVITRSGSVRSAFPLVRQRGMLGFLFGRLLPRSFHGQLGQGGHTLHASTLNGNIRLVEAAAGAARATALSESRGKP